MINEEQKYEIKVQSFVWKQKMLIAGHYEFEIIIKNLTKNSERTIYRRFSDIEWLHEGLLKFNPGCRIPILPVKNLWANINVNNSELLEKRRKHIEEYLNYINIHKYLRLNPNFQIFISNDFEKNKNEISHKGFLDKFSSISSMLPSMQSMLRTQKMKGLSTIEDNKKLDKDRENLVRLLKATNELSLNMKEYVRINEEKTEAIKNIIFSTKTFRTFNLDFHQVNFSGDEDAESKYDKSISKNMELINSFYERNKIFYSLVSSNICDQLDKYESELQGLIEIFDRKEIEETKLSTLLKEERNEEIERDLDIQKSQMEKLNEHLLDEITNFRMNRENDLLQIINKFIRDKSDCNSDISQIFENKNY